MRPRLGLAGAGAAVAVLVPELARRPDRCAARRRGTALGSRFRWKTFGVWIDSVVEEYVPGERIAWTARGWGVDAYHAWLLEPAGEVCRVLTEETQNGWLAALSNWAMPNRMHAHHQIWLVRLREQAAGGLPPALTRQAH